MIIFEVIISGAPVIIAGVTVLFMGRIARRADPVNRAHTARTRCDGPKSPRSTARPETSVRFNSCLVTQRWTAPSVTSASSWRTHARSPSRSKSDRPGRPSWTALSRPSGSKSAPQRSFTEPAVREPRFSATADRLIERKLLRPACCCTMSFESSFGKKLAYRLPHRSL